MMNRLESAARQALARLHAHTGTAGLDSIAALNEALAEQQAAEPNAILVEGFSQVALRKLNDLHEKGYAINGVSIAMISAAGETERGAVTTGGMVLWWPQQAAEPVDKVAIMQRIVDSQTGHTRTVAREPEQQAAEPVGFVVSGKFGDRCSFRSLTVKKGDTVYTAPPAPTQQPLTIPRDVVEAAQLMQDGDYRGPLFLARKVFDWVAAHGITSKEGGAA